MASKKPNLFDNIRKRKAAGKKPRKPGQKGAPSAKQWNKARREAAAKAKARRGKK
jgi:hypothetical protein